ncbi:Pectate lyase H [Cytospora mali]|uniref:Pectate lyase n=1 Tax=Cytospora mali TaxID=578113 RepID=A0A194WDQ1_CYTMA|nr:Pectate lyase H [Valsa mali]
MKFNLCTVVVAAMALGVTARPATENLKAKSVEVRHAGKGMVGGLYASATKTSGSSGSTATGSGSSTTTGTVNGPNASSGGSLPASSGTSALSAVQTIAAGESFDGGMVMYDRGVSCTGQDEGGDSDAVFQIEDGGSLSNVIIGPNQIEGVHCQGACTLTNVWWSAVCEDAFTVKNQDAGETTKISGGGAFGADDKVIQHNGAGTIAISDFTVEDFGKLYRSCGNCDSMYERHITIDGVTATSGKLLAGINSNYGDTATITNTVTTDVDEICEQFEGNETGEEPTSISTGADGKYCIYGSDVTSA